MKFETLDELKEAISEVYGEDSKIIVFENPDYAEAFLGVSHDERAIYSFDKMASCLMKNDNMSYEEAIEFVEYNTVRSLPYCGEKSPIILYEI